MFLVNYFCWGVLLGVFQSIHVFFGVFLMFSRFLLGLFSVFNVFVVFRVFFKGLGIPLDPNGPFGLCSGFTGIYWGVLTHHATRLGQDDGGKPTSLRFFLGALYFLRFTRKSDALVCFELALQSRL